MSELEDLRKDNALMRMRLKIIEAELEAERDAALEELRMWKEGIDNHMPSYLECLKERDAAIRRYDELSEAAIELKKRATQERDAALSQVEGRDAVLNGKSIQIEDLYRRLDAALEREKSLKRKIEALQEKEAIEIDE